MSAPAGRFQAPTEADEAVVARITAAARTDPDRAAAEAERAFPAGLDHPQILYLIAQRRVEAGRFAEALTLLDRAAELAPDDAEVLSDQGHCRFSLGDAPGALAAFDAALALDPQKLSALCNKAAVLAGLGDRPGARALYETAQRLHADAPAPPAALARLAAQAGDAVAARDYATRALALDPRQLGPAMALAEADLLERNYKAAERRFRALLSDRRLPPDERSRALSLLGDALDGQDRLGEAYEAYLAAPQAARRPAEAADESAVALAQRLERYFQHASPQAWRSSPGPDTVGASAARQHVFLIGFPRSGTTLLEHALAGHPDVVSLEETGALGAASAEWLRDDAALDRLAATGQPEAALDRLAAICQADAEVARAGYWSFVRGLADLGDGGRTVVDKNPLHTVRLPLIAKLFPDARLLFALRDPRDVVFSCFRRRISMGSALDEFATPEAAAAYYATVMRLAERYREFVGLPVHVVRHEALVADFRGEVGAALDFMGLAWDPGVEQYASRAAERSKTPSAAQVARGLNAEGLGQWRRYQAYLAPMLAELAPWVERFGYDPNPPAPSTPDRSALAAERLNEAQRAIGRGDWPGAFRIAEAALAEGLEQLLFFKLRALSHEQQGRPEAAIADFERVLEETPDDAAALNALGLCLAKTGRIAEGLARLDAALKLQPGYAAAHYNRGWTLEAGGDLVSARQAYERALELEPRLLQARAALASLAGRSADWPRAETLARQVLAADPAHPTAAIALARAELAQGRAVEAERIARGLLADPRRPTLHDRSLALTVIGDALDRRDQPGDAFAAYAQANAGLRTLSAGRMAGLETGLARAQRLAAEFAEIPRGDWTRPAERLPPGPADGHVFVLGFPRSGTTLLGQVLQSHPRVVTLDEQETLVDASARFLAQPGGLAQLAASDDEALAPLRDAYWRRVRGAGAEPAGKVFVDKLPMNTLGLPLIRRLFPAAKVVLVRRDPRDVVLSAFRRQFVVNPATWELLSLEGAARFYDAVMRLAELYRAGLALDLRIQSHEALVTDFEAERQGLAGFLGLDWSGAESDFAAPSRQGRIATPSAGQIAGGLSGEGVGQWRRYAAKLAPVLPILAPWVAAFGYPDD